MIRKVQGWIEIRDAAARLNDPDMRGSGPERQTSLQRPLLTMIRQEVKFIHRSAQDLLHEEGSKYICSERSSASAKGYAQMIKVLLK